MIRKPYPVAQLTGGLKVDLNAAFLTDTASPNLKMVRFDKGLVRKDLGFANFGTGERVLNGSMEANAHWANYNSPVTSEQSNEEANTGTYSWKVVTSNANLESGIQSNVFPMKANTQYTVNFSHFSNEANRIIYCKVVAGNGTGNANGESSIVSSNTGANANAWVSKSANFTSDANAAGNNAKVVVYANLWGPTEVDDETGANLGPDVHCLSMANGQAFFAPDGVNLATYAGNEGTSTPYGIRVRDSNNHEWYGYIGNAGTGMAYGSELVTDPDNEANQATFNYDTDVWSNSEQSNEQAHGGNYSTKVTLNGQSYTGWRGFADSNFAFTEEAKLYRVSAWFYLPSNQVLTYVFIDAGAAIGPYGHTQVTSNTTDAWVELVTYATLEPQISLYAHFGANKSAAIPPYEGYFYIDDISIKEVTECGAEGVHIVSTPGGNNQSWANRGVPDYPDYVMWNAGVNAAWNTITFEVYETNSCTFYTDDVSLTTTNPTDERIMYFDTFYETDGTEHFICCTLTRMYEYNSGVWEPVTGSNVFTGDADDQFSSAVWPDLFILTNGQDTVKEWDGTTFAALGGLSGISVTAAKAVIVYNSRVVLGHTTEGGSACPHRVRWSATGEPEHWDPATYADAGFVDLNDTSDWVVGFAILVDRLFVFKERSIWELLPTKDTEVFEARVVIDGVGTYAESTIVSLGDVLIFFGSDDVYLFDGSSLKSVGESLYPWLYTTGEKKVNLSRLNRAACVYVEELGDYMLALPTTGDDPDWIIKYSVNEENWTQRDKEVTAFGFWSQGDFTDWSEATGYWDDAAYAVDWTSMALPPGAPITILGGSDGLIQKDDRITTSTELMVWETKDFIFGHSERVVQMSVKCKGSGDFSVYYSTNQGRTYTLLGTHTPDASDFVTEKFFMNVTCHQIRFKIQTEATSFDIMWIEPWYIDRSRTMSPSTD